jgi:hypothetical protein
MNNQRLFSQFYVNITHKISLTLPFNRWDFVFSFILIIILCSFSLFSGLQVNLPQICANRENMEIYSFSTFAWALFQRNLKRSWDKVNLLTNLKSIQDIKIKFKTSFHFQFNLNKVLSLSRGWKYLIGSLFWIRMASLKSEISPKH